MKNRITALLALVAMAGQAQETTGRVMLTDSIAIKTDFLCQQNVMCNHDTIKKDSCQQQHRLSFVRKEQRPVWSISPNAVHRNYTVGTVPTVYVLHYSMIGENEGHPRYYLDDSYPLQFVDTDEVKANIKKNAGQWELFIYYLESKGKLKK